MNTKEAKEQLRSIAIYRQRIDQLEREKEMLENDATGMKAIDYGKDKIQTSPDADRMTDIIAHIEEIEEEWKELKQVYYKAEKEVIGNIHKIDDAHCECVLYERYVAGKSFEEIAIQMGYTYRHITRLHGWALGEYAKVA